MNLIQDIIFTVIDSYGLLYLSSEKKISKRQGLFFLVVLTAVFCLVTPLFTLADFRLKAIFTYALPICFCSLILKISVKKSIMYMGVGVTLLVISELVVVQIGNLFGKGHDLGNKVVLPAMYCVVIKIIYITLIVNVEKIMSDIMNKRICIKSLALFIFSNAGYMTVSVCIYVYAINIYEKEYNILFLICCVAMLLALVANLILSKQYFKIEDREWEQKMTIYKLQVETRYYEEKMREEERIKSIYHDMKNHILLIESKGEKNQKWVSDIKRKITKYEDYYRTGNKFLDIILSDKIEKAQRNNIRIADDISLKGIEFLEPFDISTIFGNLLDNAIEACTLVEDLKKREINISVKWKNELLVIHITNSKKDWGDRGSKKKISGYGLPNVCNAVKKYGGEISVQEKENEFIVDIIIPKGGEQK